jgi:AbrB family looped-hinge helix DNA binding protein
MKVPLDKRTRTNMTSKGQVLIPKDVRDAIGLVPGQPVDVGVNDRGEAVVLPAAAVARNETPEERSARIMAALARASLRHRTGRSTEEHMRELRGDEPLP